MPKIPAIAHNRDSDAIRHYTIASGEAWEPGALLVLDASEDLTECGADPASILGWALDKVAAGDIAGKLAGFSLTAAVYVAEAGRKAWMQGDNDPVKADINQSYGVAVDGDGIWYVDGTDQSNTRVYVHDIDTDRNMYLVSVLEANRQAAP